MKNFKLLQSNQILKFLFVSLISITQCFDSEAQNVPITDPVFKELLINSGYDTNQDDIIQVSEGLEITSIESTENNIQSLQGIEAFLNLEKIQIRVANIDHVDLSQNLKLKEIELWACKLNSIDLSNLDPRFLNLYSNNLKQIDLSSFVNLEFLNLINNELTTINLDQLTALSELLLGNDELTQVDLSNLTNLKELKITSTGITEINLSMLPNLENLDLSKNSLSVVNTSSLNKLTHLDLSQNNIKEVQLLNHPELRVLELSVNELTELDLSALSNLERLEIDWNPLAALDLSNNPKLNSLQSFNIPWSTFEAIQYHEDTRINDLKIGNRNNEHVGQIDFSSSLYEDLYFLQLDHESDIDYDFSPLANLRTLDYSGPMKILDLNSSSRLSKLEYGKYSNDYPLEILMINNGSEEDVEVFTNQIFLNLKNICCDYNQLEEISQWAESIELQCSISSYCAFNNFENRSKLSGEILIDPSLSDCSNSNNIILNNRQNIKITNAGIVTTYITEPSGKYQLAISPGAYNLEPDFNNDYFISSPNEVDISVIDNSTDLIQDFNITSNGEHQELSISLMPMRDSSPGFKNTYLLKMINRGNTCNQGTLNFEFDETLTELISMMPSGNHFSPGSISFDYEIVPFQSLSFELEFEHNTPMDTPPLNGNDILKFTVTDSNRSLDSTPEDNSFILEDEVVNSFDPNDITCLEGKNLHKTKLGDFVHYRIRFENTGTANAVNVVVQNTIDLEKFDFESLEIIESSHPVVGRMLAGGSAEFIFADIQLPFDDANNHGFLLYKIRTKKSLEVNEEFTNQAAIYFDFNFPIVTDIYATKIVEDVTSTINDKYASGLSVFPNPTNDIVNIMISGSELQTIEIYNLQGQLLLNFKGMNQIDVSVLKRGTYLMKIRDYQNKIFTQRLVLLE